MFCILCSYFFKHSNDRVGKAKCEFETCCVSSYSSRLRVADSASDFLPLLPQDAEPGGQTQLREHPSGVQGDHHGQGLRSEEDGGGGGQG